mmetsp:Transcript_151/g.163  ORF Transcript_151/g.163 Transcript_151/m.163 type:complete len:83 (+) Transcript_151:111-359(+)
MCTNSGKARRMQRVEGLFGGGYQTEGPAAIVCGVVEREGESGIAHAGVSKAEKKSQTYNVMFRSTYMLSTPPHPTPPNHNNH